MKIKFLLLFLNFAFFTSDPLEDIANAIRSGNSKNISSYFIENIDLKINEKEGVYSKQQAEMILKDFFVKHAAKSFAVIHKSITKNASQYVIGKLETAQGKFRIYLLLKSNGNEMLIQQFRIEDDNE
jgi:hypothetical protein